MSARSNRTISDGNPRNETPPSQRRGSATSESSGSEDFGISGPAQDISGLQQCELPVRKDRGSAKAPSQPSFPFLHCMAREVDVGVYSAGLLHSGSGPSGQLASSSNHRNALLPGGVGDIILVCTIYSASCTIGSGAGRWIRSTSTVSFFSTKKENAAFHQL